MFSYRLSVMDSIRRCALIKERCRESNALKTEYKFRNGQEQLKLIVVPIDVLIYRLENYRTRELQASLIAKGKHPRGFFDKTRQEDISVQQAQHELLLSESKQGSGETIKPIFGELQRVRKQTEEIIITADGVIVNGNRRVSAMRELCCDSSGEFSDYGLVKCAVLPQSATAKEIRALEISLQMQPETKLPYGWVALGSAARDLIEDGESEEEIARKMNRDRKEIARAIAKRDMADLYLNEWLSTPDDYARLDGTEQAFTQIVTRNLNGSKPEHLKEAARSFDFFMIEQRKHLMDERAYDVINIIEDYSEDVLKKFADEKGIVINKATSPAHKHKIRFDEDETENALEYSVLVDALKSAQGNESDARDTAILIQNIANSVIEQGRNRDKAALKFASEALKRLNCIDLTTAAPETISDLISVLNKVGDKSLSLASQALDLRK